MNLLCHRIDGRIQITFPQCIIQLPLITNTWTPTYSALASTTDNKYYGRGILWASLWAIIYNTAQYGDHFTDALK